MTTPMAAEIAPIAEMKKKATLTRWPPRSLVLPSQRRALDRFGQQHLLGEDQVRAGVVRELVVVAHGDGVKRAGHLAVAAEDAAREIDFVHRGVALAGG